MCCASVTTRWFMPLTLWLDCRGWHWGPSGCRRCCRWAASGAEAFSEAGGGTKSRAGARCHPCPPPRWPNTILVRHRGTKPTVPASGSRRAPPVPALTLLLLPRVVLPVPLVRILQQLGPFLVGQAGRADGTHRFDPLRAVATVEAWGKGEGR